MRAIAHEGCTDTVRESALEVDPGRLQQQNINPLIIVSGTGTRVRIAPGVSVGTLYHLICSHPHYCCFRFCKSVGNEGGGKVLAVQLLQT